MTEDNIFSYSNLSITKARCPLLKVTALNFGKLVILNTVGVQKG